MTPIEPSVVDETDVIPAWGFKNWFLSSFKSLSILWCSLGKILWPIPGSGALVVLVLVPLVGAPE